MSNLYGRLNDIKDYPIHEGSKSIGKAEAAVQIYSENHSEDDCLLLKEYTFEDLDINSVRNFKREVSYLFQDQGFEQMDDQTFLRQIGAMGKDENTDKWLLRKGTLLFLGKVENIRKVYPGYKVEYVKHPTRFSPGADRISSDSSEGNEMNLFNFYTTADQKLSVMTMSPFKLDEYGKRVPERITYVSIREALINCLEHADYEAADPSIKVDLVSDHVIISNPGELLVQAEQFKAGFLSKPGNELIMKFFCLMGKSRMKGSGGPIIYQAADVMEFPDPILISDDSRTELTIWAVTIPGGGVWPQKSRKERVMDVLSKYSALSFPQMRRITGLSEYKLRSGLKELCKNGEVRATGAGRAVKYTLCSSHTDE